jgi:hypothetical protein
MGSKFQKGGYNKASLGVNQEDFNLDESWSKSLGLWNQNHDKNFHLTLSGHTYAIWDWNSGYKWSLAQYVYAQWAGLYET